MANDGARLRFAPIAAVGAGDTEIVAAVANKKIVVHNYTVVSAAAVTVKFRSASTDLTGPMACAANSGVSAPGGENARHFATAIGEALNLNLSGAFSVGGHLAYTLE